MSTVAALREGARDARGAWGPTQSLVAGLVGFLALLPALGLGFVHVDELAAWLYLALAASGLVLAVGFAGLPSLGQGAFMGVGALATSVLAGRAGWPPMAALPIAVAASVLAGLVSGLAVVRLPRVFVAVSTWLLTWLVALAAAEFPWLSGGSQGYVVSSPLGPTAHYELALGLTVAVVALLSVFRASAAGIRLRAVRDNPAAAAVLGVPGDRLLYGAFVVSAGVAGLAGALSVQLAGVSDPDAFGPLTSFRLLVAVLLGGASYAAAGVAGVAVLGAVSLVAHLEGSILGDVPQLQPMLTAALLLAVLGLGKEGLIPWIAGRRPRRMARRAVAPPPARPRRPAAVHARELAKTYGGVRALSGFELDVAPGEAVALVGANGSGKTTALRALGGAFVLDAGVILLDGRPVGTGPRELAQAGVVRTLQRTAVFGSLTALETVLVGAALHARHSGPLRAVTATPKARAEAPLLRGAALEALREVELEDLADERSELLDGFQRRRLMLAAALATQPRLLLLDEPSAGVDQSELPVLAHILRRVQTSGVSVVLVEHNQLLVRAVADRVLTIADGKVV
jgi:ABC-type branched-subunit amino acid transport system ATPase component/ABC-type branched-subunit amino acid transport system permease subunit